MGNGEQSSLEPTFKTVTDLSSDSIFLLDRDYRIVFINRTAEGLSIQDAVGTVLFELLTEDQAKIARQAFRRVEETGEKTSYEITFPLPDGSISRWRTHIGPRSDGGFVVVSSDVTAQTSTQDELDLLFALSQDMLFVAGYDGVFQRVSPAAVDALGYTFEELMTRQFLDFVHPDDRERTKDVFQDIVVFGNDVHLFENRYATKDGSYRLLQWTSRPDPASRRVVAIARDVTEARAMEQQLRQAQKMDAIGQLAGGVAHDFNNLIQSIFGALDFAKSETTIEQILTHLLEIEMAAERASELTQQLLSFSRRQPFATTRVDLNVLLQGPVTLLRRVLPATVEVRVHEGRGEQLVLCDRVQLEQVLLNLCLNARDAMPQGGRIDVVVGKQTVSEEQSELLYDLKPGAYATLSVQDQGEGMTAEVRERMFEPFFTTKPTGQGTGLGMSMAYGAVKQHGGTIHVDSEPGKGTRVTLLLPLVESDCSSERELRSTASAQMAVGHERILLAEDDALVRSFCIRALEGAGYEVLAASDGMEAIELARAHSTLDLALFDVIMPGATGPQAYATISEIHPELPVLFSSGYSDESNRNHTLPTGARILMKPLRMSALLSAVREILDGRS